MAHARAVQGIYHPLLADRLVRLRDRRQRAVSAPLTGARIAAGTVAAHGRDVEHRTWRNHGGGGRRLSKHGSGRARAREDEELLMKHRRRHRTQAGLVSGKDIETQRSARRGCRGSDVLAPPGKQAIEAAPAVGASARDLHRGLAVGARGCRCPAAGGDCTSGRARGNRRHGLGIRGLSHAVVLYALHPDHHQVQAHVRLAVDALLAGRVVGHELVVAVAIDERQILKLPTLFVSSVAFSLSPAS